MERLGEGALRTVTNVIPRGIGEGIDGIKYMIDSDGIKQGVDEWLDVFKRKLAFDTYDKHDIFGNEIKDRHPVYNLLGIKNVKADKEDSWLDDLIDDGIGFQMPKSSIVVNKTRLEINDRQAECIRMEMKELGAEKAIKETAEQIKNAPKVIKKDIIQNLFASFRETAIIMYYNKDKDLQDQYVKELDRKVKQLELEETKENVPSMKLDGE